MVFHGSIDALVERLLIFAQAPRTEGCGFLRNALFPSHRDSGHFALCVSVNMPAPRPGNDATGPSGLPTVFDESFEGSFQH